MKLNLFGINPKFGIALAKVMRNIAAAANQAGVEAQLKHGGEVKIVDNVYVKKERIRIEHDTVLDLKGKTIAAAFGSTAVTVLYVDKGANVTIKNGIVDASADELQCIMVKDGTLTIESGTYIGGPTCSCIYAQTDNAKVIINGGYFKCAAPYNGLYYVINAKNGTHPTIIVNGGQFENYDPATGDDADGGNYLGEGKVSVLEGNVYTVK